MQISICIATHERPESLRRTVATIEQQTVRPYEVVISDSSGADNRPLLDALALSPLKVKRLRSTSRALPWQRSWAFRHSSGDVILFLDDDVLLNPQALQILERAYKRLSADCSRKVAGVGFRMVYDDGTEPKRNPLSVRERWLGMSSLPPGSLTPGGLTVSIAELEGREPVEVDVLWGGAMSFRREALADLPLGNLVSLYEAGIGRGEDAVLSFHARRAGKLFVLTEPFAVHPVVPMQVATPYAKEGWRLGLTRTLGRAHTMRWMASSWSAYKEAWWRMVLLELGRCGAAIVSSPWQGKSWMRLAGTFAGIGLTVARWSKIPSHPTQSHLAAANRESAVSAPQDTEYQTPKHKTPAQLVLFWDYDTQWGADRSRMPGGPKTWGALEFENTERLLELHAEYDVPACFAVVGSAALGGERPYHDPGQIRRIHEAGHEVASHSHRHEWLPGLNETALRETLHSSKDALEQCIGESVVSFVPPFNQPFDHRAGWSFSRSERREAGRERTDLARLCATLAETGYRFCRVAYRPMYIRVYEKLLRRRIDRPSHIEMISGVRCVRINTPCGFGLRTTQLIEDHLDEGGIWIIHAHPHSLNNLDTPQTGVALEDLLKRSNQWRREGRVGYAQPRDLLAGVSPVG